MMMIACLLRMTMTTNDGEMDISADGTHAGMEQAGPMAKKGTAKKTDGTKRKQEHATVSEGNMHGRIEELMTMQSQPQFRLPPKAEERTMGKAASETSANGPSDTINNPEENRMGPRRLGKSTFIDVIDLLFITGCWILILGDTEGVKEIIDRGTTVNNEVTELRNVTRLTFNARAVLRHPHPSPRANTAPKNAKGARMTS